MDLDWNDVCHEVPLHRLFVLSEDFHKGLQEVEDGLAGVLLPGADVEDGALEEEEDHRVANERGHTRSIDRGRRTRKRNRPKQETSRRAEHGVPFHRMGPKLPPLRMLDESHALGMPVEMREELQAKSLAAFTWRTLELLRDAWGRMIPGGRVELVMFDFREKCGYVLGRAHIETLPFPWPSKRMAFYFYTPGILRPVPLCSNDPMLALHADGVSVRSLWVQQVINEALKVLGGGPDRKSVGPS